MEVGVQHIWRAAAAARKKQEQSGPTLLEIQAITRTVGLDSTWLSSLHSRASAAVGREALHTWCRGQTCCKRGTKGELLGGAEREGSPLS